jgi:hypothetical protein
MQVYWLYLCLTAIGIYDHDLMVVIRDLMFCIMIIGVLIVIIILVFLRFTVPQKFTRGSNKSPTRCNNFPGYYPDVYLQLNMFQAVFLPIIRSSMTAVAASGLTFISWCQSCCVRGRAGWPDHEHSTTVTTIRR